ncbi:uncharacterized protein LOC130998745 [Salvia miltiorrhiza]|uniref:uncharacterized protein LOC130998745 n=1 Tax=Salvia miltiorrhiza TaxID=226208 RepID=UPI0025ABDE0D|nr:uncharacterized protein LOC130998745 [Salvia miltiorrhiza]
MESVVKDLQAQIRTLSAQVDTQLRQSQADFQKQLDEFMVILKNTHSSSSIDDASNTFPHGRPPFVRLDVPRFDGTDPYSWIFKIEEYFGYHNTPDAQRLQIVSFHLDGKASTWFQWLKSQHMLSSWSDFLNRVKSRFGDSQFDDPEGTLAKLSQQCSVANYQSTFESLMGRTKGISEPLLISFYISGLKPSIRRDLQLNRPPTLDETFALSRVFESKYMDSQTDARTFARPLPRPTLPTAVTTNSTTAVPPIPPRPSAVSSSPSPVRCDSPTIPVRRLTPAETREKRERGLCFHCDQRWNPSHRCKTPSTVLLLAGDDATFSLEAHDILDSPDHPLDDDIILGDVSSLHSLSGAAQPRSLRLWGSIQTQRFQMIDYGSTHNFITPNLAQRLKSSLTAIPNFWVYIGNGDFIICQHKCMAVSIDLQGTSFTCELFVLPIKGPDIILGIQWLQELGQVIHDYRCGHMEFEWHGKRVILDDDNFLTSHQVSFSMLQSLVNSGEVEVDTIYEIWHIGPHQRELHPFDLQTIPPAFHKVLTEFTDVFDAPRGLPPRRLLEHRIYLAPGSKPVNVRPYRYPYFQKNEMERLVREMLDQGIIRPSQSPFSSPVLLVKKKDGSYRFCVDYRALNAVTVKDKFPISTVDELLDELGQSTVFSKLDLRAGFHQIRVHDKDIFKTAFRTHDGHFEFLVMPFGLTNASSTFQATMNFILKDFLRRFSHCFFVKFSKCTSGTSSVDYLGHIVSSGTVRADPAKIEAMLAWPIPSSAKKLQGFLGLTDYYRKFVQNYAAIASPLTDLLCKDSFVWSDNASIAFHALKQAMASTPILRLHDFSK